MINVCAGKGRSRISSYERKVTRLCDNFIGGGWHSNGTMEIYELGKNMVDVIAMTFMMYLYRLHSEEAWRSSSHGGGGGGGGGG